MDKVYFSDVGKVVTGDRYVNRIKKEQEIIKKVFCPSKNYGSISIVGLPRIGKTSLVTNTIEKNRDYIKDNNIIYIQHDITKFPTPYAFYKVLIDDIYDELSDEEKKNSKFERCFNKITVEDFETYGPYQIFKLFKCIKTEFDRRIIIVLDEFDHVKKLFSIQAGGINFLRELATSPDTDVTFIVISRRIISELEENLDCSTFAQALSAEIYVSYYDDSEIIEFNKYLEKHSIELTEEEYQNLIYITGKHPFLIDTMLSYYMQEDNEHEKSFYKLLKNNINEFYGIFDKLCKILENQKLLDKVYQLKFGPKINCTNEDIAKLKSYGVIYFDNSALCQLFSSEFDDYLHMKELTGDFQTLWNQTEKYLRNIVKTKYLEKFKNSWEIDFIKELENMGEYIIEKQEKYHKDLLNNLNESKKRMKNSKEKCLDLFNEKIKDTTILDFLDTGALLSLIYFMYNEYELDKIFNMTKFIFIKESNDLRNIRNNYQHNNSDLLNEEKVKQAKTFCDKLNKKMLDWLAKIPK